MRDGFFIGGIFITINKRREALMLASYIRIQKNDK
jgi:hypothetical protein